MFAPELESAAHNFAGVIGRIDTLTGNFDALLNSNLPLTDMDVAANGTIFGITFGDFYRLNLSNMTTTKVGATGAVLNALEVGPNGTIYAAGPTDTNLYTINSVTGGATVAFNIGYYSAGDLQFVGNTLYMASTSGSLVAIDPVGRRAIEVGKIGFSDVYGLALDSNGNLIGLSQLGEAYEINAATGAAALISNSNNNYGGAATEMQQNLPTDFFTTVKFGFSFSVPATAYKGPVSYLNFQYFGSQPGEVTFGTDRNDFLNLFAGDDACNAGAGSDVIDGGLGSNFLTGGPGKDVFFLDGRGGGTTWATITDWEQGEQLSVWGFRLGVSKLQWVQNAGAEGFKGLTMHADLDGNGKIDTSVTWTSIASQSQLPPAYQFDGLLWFT